MAFLPVQFHNVLFRTLQEIVDLASVFQLGEGLTKDFTRCTSTDHQPPS